MAACYRDFENPGDELNALNKALAIRTQIFGGQHFRTAEIFSEIGSYFLHLERGDSSLSYYNRALGIYKRQLGENHYAVAQTYDRLAKAYALKSNTEQEFYYLNESLNKKKFAGNAPKSNKTAQLSGTAEVADEFGESQTRQNHIPSQLYESYLNLAKFYGRKKDYTLALNYCQSALASVCPSLKNSKDYYQNPSIEELSHDIAWLDAIYTKSDLVLKLYQNQSKTSKDLDFAVKSFELSVALIDTLRFHFTSDGSKEQLAKRSLPVYEGAVAVLSEVYNTSKDPKILDRIFTMMERSKAFVLMQAIQNVQAKTAGGVPAELLVKEESLRRGMAYYSDYKNRKNEDRGFDKMYFQTKKSYDSLILVIETQYPKYYKLKYELKPIVLQQVREKILHEDDAILEYFVGDAALYGFVITKTAVFFDKIVLDKTFESDIYALRSNLTNYAAIAKNAEQAHRDFTRHSAAVFSKYVQPFTKNLPENTQKLIVVTDGLLSYLPFDILLTESVGGQLIPYAELPYLFKKYQLNYTYSTGLLMENLAERRISNNQKCLAFAPTYSEQNGNTHDDLPWAQKELEDIQKTFVGQYVFGKTATKSAFMEAASEYGIIHLAMHGVVNWRNAQKSYLAFATVDTDSTGEASNLYNYDIQNLYLNADLVVLSACETGFGKVIRGEGVLSLSRGFMYAGVPSMVTTLWQVNDYASATLMMLFYANLERGFSKPEALRLAKLEFVSKGDLISGHPAFWASFVTLGNPQALRYGWAWWQWGILAVVLAGAGLGLFIVGKRYIRFKHAEHEANKQPEKSVEELITENLRRKIKASQAKQKTGQP
jgi:CHAT domain-containing protein